MRPAVRITPVCYACQPGPWPYVLTADLRIDLGCGFIGEHRFIDKGISMAHLKGDQLTIYAGYASNGCSPYFGNFFGLRIGTPTPRGNAAASWFVHDLLYQFGELVCAPWSYDQADDIFFQLMRQHSFPLAGAYHVAVSVLGGLHRQLTRAPSTTIACLTTHNTRA